jgi:hypothetical protein
MQLSSMSLFTTGICFVASLCLIVWDQRPQDNLWQLLKAMVVGDWTEIFGHEIKNLKIFTGLKQQQSNLCRQPEFIQDFVTLKII